MLKIKAHYNGIERFTLPLGDGTFKDVIRHDMIELTPEQWEVLGETGDWDLLYRIDETGEALPYSSKHISYTSAVNRVTGYGKQGYLILRNLMDLGFDVSYYDVRVAMIVGSPQDVDERTRQVLEAADRPMTEWNVCHSIAETIDALPHKKKIGWTMWEADQLPREVASGTIFREWPRRLNSCEAVIVPATTQKTICEESGVTRPIYVVHDAVDTNYWQYHERKRPERPFTFFSWGYMNKRKAPMETVNAFFSAFGPNNPNVRLVMKTMDRQFGFSQTIGVPNFNFASNVEIIDSVWPEEKLLDYIYDEVDACVFNSFGEGQNDPPLEALSTGLPVVVPDHSGQYDYCHESEGKHYGIYPTRTARMEPAPQAPDYMKWWVPDFDHMIENMRYVMDNYDEALRDAKRGSAWIKRRWSMEHQRKLLGETLDKICS